MLLYIYIIKQFCRWLFLASVDCNADIVRVQIGAQVIQEGDLQAKITIGKSQKPI